MFRLNDTSEKTINGKSNYRHMKYTPLTTFQLVTNLLAQAGYPFVCPTLLLNDPSQNKRIAIRRLEVRPTIYSFLPAVLTNDIQKLGEELYSNDICFLLGI